MNKTTKNSAAAMEFSFTWETDVGSHTDCRYVQNVNLWRDIFPGTLHESLMDKTAGDVIETVFEPGDLIPDFNDSLIVGIKGKQIDRDMASNPRYGRYYPKGMLGGVAGIFKENREPFRCAQSDDTGIHADMNHPLSGRSVLMKTEIETVGSRHSERGGSCMALEDLVLNGPGMQTRINGRATDFFSDDPFSRDDETDDAGFYERPRLVNHLDDMAIEVISDVYGRLIPPGSDVLDLMSSWKSHMPEELELGTLTGLGMNPIELEANSRLTNRVIHDLNRNTELPFDDKQFDAVLLTVSVEYLTRPFEVFADIARVLKPGGLLAVSFSNRWFPPKAIRIWKGLHEFERMGLVSEYFLKSKKFKDIHTWSMRGKPRPFDDKYFGLNMMLSDPMYMVWATRNE